MPLPDPPASPFSYSPCPRDRQYQGPPFKVGFPALWGIPLHSAVLLSRKYLHKGKPREVELPRIGGQVVEPGSRDERPGRLLSLLLIAARKRESIQMSSRRIAGLTLVVVAILLTAVGAVADEIRGGVLYDKWWNVNGEQEPTGDHPLYPPVGTRTGSTTFRCKECHGWDYKGVDGAYGPGSSHFTGIPGVFGTTMSAQEIFDVIKNPPGTTPNGHDFGNIGLSDNDVQDLVDLLQLELIDTDHFISQSAVFIGDEVQGEVDYLNGGLCCCWACHGVNGADIDFEFPDGVYVGTIASENPWEFIHKVRFGQPGTGMPSWVGNAGTDQEAANIGRHAQMNLVGGTLVFEDGFEPGDTSAWE